MVESKTLLQKAVTGLLYLFLALAALACILPFLYIISASLTPMEELIKNPLILFPRKPNLDTYKYIFSTGTVIQALGNSVFITLAGTAANMIMTILLAYPLAHNFLPGKKIINQMIVFTMIFSGGMIPSYIIVNSLGMINSFSAVIIPGAINAFNLIVLRNFFSQIPESLEESARIDGANEFLILFKIILPLSMASLATITLFYAVAHWSAFQQPLLYLTKPEKWPIQILLRQLIVLSSGAGLGDSGAMDVGYVVPQQSVRMATIIVSTVPILIIYPFLQKYFTKGVMMGSVKG